MKSVPFFLFSAIIFFLIHCSLSQDNKKDQCDEDIEKVNTTTPKPKRRCPYFLFKRKNGDYCTALFRYTFSTRRLDFDLAVDVCRQHGGVLTGMETKTEWDFYKNFVKNATQNIQAVWVGADYNNSTNQYEWNDGFTSDPKIPLKITVEDPKGAMAWFPLLDSNELGYGSMKIVNKTGMGPPTITGFMCGYTVM